MVVKIITEIKLKSVPDVYLSETNMNILQMKYAVEVAKKGSISKASESLYVAQPNLSRSIKELESNLGITIFERSTSGMTPTKQGKQFLSYAIKILSQINEVERLFKEKVQLKQKLSVSVPRTSYISDAFVSFSKTLTNEPCEIVYKETNALRTIKNILTEDYKLGIIRYATHYDQYFKEMLEEKELSYEIIATFNYVLATSKNSALASKKEIILEDLNSFLEIAHADPYVPALSSAYLKKEELPDNIERRIFVFERGSQFELLSENPNTFMWVSPLPPKTLKRFDLVQKQCKNNHKQYKDLLIYPKNYKLTELDKKFIAEVKLAKEKYLGS